MTTGWRAVTSVLLALSPWLYACTRKPARPAAISAFEIPPRALVALPLDSLLHDVRDVRVDGGGRIWVLSGFRPFLRVYAADGRRIGSFGRAGHGPGELGTPWYLLARPGGPAQMTVHDVGRRRLVTLDTAGTLISESQIGIGSGTVNSTYRRENFGEPNRTVSFGHGYVIEVYNGVVTRSAHLWQGQLVSLDSAGAVRDTLVRYADLRVGDLPKETPVLGAAPLFAACGAGIALLQPETMTVRGIRPGGSWDEPRHLEVPSIPITREDVQRWVQRGVDLEARQQGIDRNSPDLLRLIRQVVDQQWTTAPKSAPVVRLRCDPAGDLWVQLFSTATDERGYGPTWGRFDATGGTTSRLVSFPTGFQPLQFARDRIVGFVEDADGVQTPAWVPYPTDLAPERLH